MDHLLLHCYIAKEVCSMVFSMSGIQWVMPKGVMELLACWQGSFGQYGCIEIWKAIPPCLMWCIWWERNARTKKTSNLERND